VKEIILRGLLVLGREDFRVTNLQFYFTMGVPTFFVLFGIILNRADVTSLRAEMAVLRAELRAEIAALRTELRAEIATLRSELRSEMAILRTELHGGMAALRDSIHRDMVSLHERVAIVEERNK